MPTTFGTHHFTCRSAIKREYPQHDDDNIDNMLKDGSVCLGEPPCADGESVYVKSGRYRIVAVDKSDTMTERQFTKRIKQLLMACKPDIQDDFRADEETSLPSMQITVGAEVGIDGRVVGWNWQSGDNSYSGGAYGFSHWGVVGLYRRSNCAELAKQIVEEIYESAS